MKPSDTAAAYNKIAQHWASASFPAKNGLAQHERALQFLVRPGLAIDVGCGGNGRLIDLLLARGFEVEGLDISTEMLALAKARHPSVNVRLGDICAWEFTRAYDFISAWDSIWHVPLDCHPAVLEKLCDALSPGGVLIFSTGGVDGPGEVTNPCHGEPLYHAALGIPHLLRLIAEFGCICRHLEYDQHPELHLYVVVQKPNGAVQTSAAIPVGASVSGSSAARPHQPRRQASQAKYLVSFPSTTMVVPADEFAAVGRDAHAVAKEAKAAGD